MMEIEFSPTLADFKHATRLDRRVNLFHLVSHFALTWFAPSIALVLIFLMVVASSLFAVRFEVGSSVTFGALALCLFAPFLEQWILRKSFRSMFPDNAFERRIRFTILQDGVDVEIPGVAEAKYQWGAFVRSVQDESFMLLYVSNTRFVFFPISTLSLEDRAELNELMARHLPKGKQ